MVNFHTLTISQKTLLQGMTKENTKVGKKEVKESMVKYYIYNIIYILILLLQYFHPLARFFHPVFSPSHIGYAKMRKVPSKNFPIWCHASK